MDNGVKERQRSNTETTANAVNENPVNLNLTDDIKQDCITGEGGSG